MKLADRVADLERRLAQLEPIVADLCEDKANEDDTPTEDLDGNSIPTFPKGGPLDTL